MRPTGIILLFLWVTAATVCSQSVRMDVHNEPLNKVLSRLQLELSFDDRTLSEYNISVSKSFENPESALLWLLEDKPFRVERIKNVYVIIPCDNQKKNPADRVFGNIEVRPFSFKGTVVSQTTGEPLEYAIVSLLDADSIPIATGFTTDKGQFAIKTSRVPASIKIGSLGYRTRYENIRDVDGNLGVIHLNDCMIPLGEVVVTAEKTSKEIHHTTYVITPQMLRGVHDALELSDKIPGIYFDQSSNSVWLNHHANILLLVDGVPYSETYLRHLSPDRIEAIEVIHAVSGRFVSDDYAGIIQFVLKKNYTGYDLHASNAVWMNLSKTAENCRLPENHPSLGFIYTTHRLNFFGMYEYDREKSNYHATKSLTYDRYKLVSHSVSHPAHRYRYDHHTVNGGINYHLTPFQILGMQSDYTRGSTKTLQQYTMRRTDLSNNYDRSFTSETENLIQAHTFTGSLFYKGQFANRLHVYADFSYNYYDNDMKNEYHQGGEDVYRYSDLWNEYKKQTGLNFEGKYSLSHNMSIEAGYSNLYRRYASKSSQGIGFLNYKENRNRASVYFSRLFSDRTRLRAGVAFEHIYSHNGITGKHTTRILPYVWMNVKITSKGSLIAGYTANSLYPSLYQLSPMSIVVDTFLTQIGNPDVTSAVRHHGFMEISLGDKLKLMPQVVFINDGISEVYDRKAYKLYRTFNQIDFREYSLNVSYNQSFGRYFRLKSTLTFYHQDALYEANRNSVNGWMIYSDGNFYHPDWAAGIQFGYYRNMKKNILWQGYYMSGKDFWSITARKELWNHRISVMLSYIPPIEFGVRNDRIKYLDTPLYKERTTTDLSSYHPTLLLKVGLRFDHGTRKEPVENKTIKMLHKPER